MQAILKQDRRSILPQLTAQDDHHRWVAMDLVMASSQYNAQQGSKSQNSSQYKGQQNNKPSF